MSNYWIKREDLFFAGQMTGVEGYLESASSGMVAGINMARMLEGKELIDFTRCTSIGALQNYISIYNNDFVPMNANFCLFESLDDKIVDEYMKEKNIKRAKKLDRKTMYADRSLKLIDDIVSKGI